MASLSPAALPHKAQLLLSFALGGLAVLGFAPFNHGLLLPLIMALLLHLLWRSSGIWAATRLGYAFGLGLMGFGVSWLRISIGQFGGVGTALALAITALFIVLVALYFALYGAFVRWLVPAFNRPAWTLLLAPAAWFWIEWLRGWLFTGFPWLSLGYSQLDLPLAGYAPVIGSFGVGLLVLVSAGLLTLWKRLWALPLLALFWFGGYGLGLVQWTRPIGKPLVVAIVQGNIPQKIKWQPSEFVPSLRTYLRLTEEVPNARLVVWPETAIAGFEGDLETSVLKPLQRYFASQGRDLLTGIVAGKRNGPYYNAMISLGASGRGHYYKNHLVPFGEYLPLKGLLGPLLRFVHIPMSDFSSGDEDSPLIEVAGHPVGVDICYEDAFASEVMRALPKAQFLVNASNDAWFGNSLAPHQHLQIARMRALEAGRPLLNATNTGVSAILDDHGDIQAVAAQFHSATLTARIWPRTGLTPYARWEDTPLLVLAGLILLLAIVRRMRSPKRED